jgi:maleate isomerase
MPDIVGYRIKFGVIIPSTNTVVEADYNRMAPHGVTFHTGRMYISRPALDSDAAFEALLGEIRQARATAVRDVVTCKPDYIVMGMSAETFWGGVEGNTRFVESVREQSGGLEVSTGASACRAGLQALRCQRIAALSPYQPIADKNVTRFFEESGFTVVRFKGLRCPTATAVAEVTEHALLPVLRQLDGPDVDAVMQVGTNLSMVRLADEGERWL